ncbi:MAG: 16S rRNA (guanine(966)-N(2))-methyltransferase RsmD [Defluviitaleaceae bacterium]|nr:16S rRNA (guanine(966)-N(2))-methyltransferase RsmD [Defluviitaleaceae bacterium]
MRIIAGTAKGTKLTAPHGTATRPTADRMKEDLFNILTAERSGLNGLNGLKGIAFLDLYCGSGQMGIEALSRGAKTAVFVDSSDAAISATKANLQKAKLTDKATILKMPIKSAFSNNQLLSQKYDVIFMDPPYQSQQIPMAIGYVTANNLLSANGILIAECPANLILPNFAAITQYRTKKYTQMQFVFYTQQRQSTEN